MKQMLMMKLLLGLRMTQCRGGGGMSRGVWLWFLCA
jgi:hypothetical protein